MESSTTDTLLFILSVCAVLLTSALVIGIYFFLGFLKQIQQFIEGIHSDIERFKMKREELETHGTPFLNVAKLLFKWWFFRRK